MSKAKALLTALLLVGIAGIGAAIAQQPAAPTPQPAAAKTKDSKATETKSKETKGKEAKAKQAKPKDAKAKGGKKEAKEAKKGTKPKEVKSKETKARETKARETKAKEPKAADSKAPSKSATIKATPPARADTGSLPLPVVRTTVRPGAGMALAGTSATPPADIEATKQAIAHARAGRTAQATDVQRGIKDPVARKLVEWAILRSDGNGSSAARYIAFIDDNPDWPSIGMLRRRAESMLWTEQPAAGAVRAYFSRHPPLSAKGHFALARVLLASGDRERAQAEVRDAWHNDAFGADLEAQALEAFGSLLTTADHKVRMDMRLYAEDVEAGLRNANRVGGAALAIAKARVAVIRKAGNAKAALDAVPAAARNDAGYVFSLAQWHRRGKRPAEAGETILKMQRDPALAIDPDQWWVERRLAARSMLDLGHAAKAYRIARDTPVPKKNNFRAEHHFTAGWIALRFVNDPAAAQTHFARILDGERNPITLARGHYWLGRALEAQNRGGEAKAQYQAAAQYPTSYYGQIANARLGNASIVLRSPPPPPPGALEIVRAVELLYAVGQQDMVIGILADLADRSNDAAGLAALGEVAARHGDARAMLFVGKPALGRGLPLETYAFPTIGIPAYNAVGHAVEKSLIYAIARQESTFHPTIVSKARAMGLMQVTPGTGRLIAKKYNVAFNERKLLSDPAFNVQLGAAELGNLMADFRGSYILTFVGYNAGRGRVRDWVAAYGDPRDPRIDPVDWVERIPISETRYYIQRVMENMQVYRVRFGTGAKLTIEADLRRGAAAN